MKSKSSYSHYGASSCFFVLKLLRVFRTAKNHSRINGGKYGILKFCQNFADL